MARAGRGGGEDGGGHPLTSLLFGVLGPALEPERWELLRDDELAGDDSLEDLGYTVDLAAATQAQRQAEDGLPLPRRTEDGMP